MEMNRKEFIEEILAAEKEFEEKVSKCLQPNEYEILFSIFEECKSILLKKKAEYNSGGISLGDYYPRGIYSAIDVINANLLRMYSFLEADDENSNKQIEECALNLVNYAAIFIGILRKHIETPNRVPRMYKI